MSGFAGFVREAYERLRAHCIGRTRTVEEWTGWYGPPELCWHLRAHSTSQFGDRGTCMRCLKPRKPLKLPEQKRRDRFLKARQKIDAAHRKHRGGG